MTVSALACAIARGKSDNELALLSAFFTQLGDSLATIESGNILCCENDSNEKSGNVNDTVNIT